MSKLVAEEGEGRALDYGVYGIIRDLIIKEGCAKFVNNSGRYVVNWDRALEYYEAYRRKKDPDFNGPRRRLSNDLRSALLSSSYKKDGAKEYRESRKRSNDDEVVERQFQMPHKVFKSLFGNTESSDSSEAQDEQGAGRAQVSPAPESSSDTGYDTVNITCGPSERVDSGSLHDPANVRGTYNQGGSSDIQMISAKPKEIPSQVEEPCKIVPNSGPRKGGYEFVICLRDCLPDTVSSGMAEFEGVHTVELKRLNAHTFLGFVPASRYAFPVGVKVTSQCGDWLGTTSFSYYDDICNDICLADRLKVVVDDPYKQAELFSSMSRDLVPGNLDSTIQAKHKQSVKILEVLVYTAAQIGAKPFIEMIFSTSAQRTVFDSYKDRAQLPEDVARANGHCNLAQYLQDITMRLTKEADDKPKTIDWLELLKAVQNQVSASQDKESKEETSSVESDYNSSDYFADTETSSCGSSEDDDVFTSNSEGKDAVEKDANHLEHSKTPDNRKQNGAFPGDLDGDVNECRGAISIILKKENHRQEEVYGKEYRVYTWTTFIISAPCEASNLLGFQVTSPEFGFGICLSIAEMKAIARTFSRRCCSIVEMKEIAKTIFGNTHIAVGDFARFPGGTPSKCFTWRGVFRYESKEEKRVLMTENAVVSASTCRLKRPGCLVLSPLKADERQVNQEQVIFEKSIGDESVHSLSTLLPSCSVINKSRPQPDNSASLHGLSSGNVSWKNESNMKELTMARVRSWLCRVVSLVATSQDKESKEETTPAESDDNSSDYFANAETSCESFEHDDEVTSNPEGKDAAEKDSPTGESKERLLKDPPYSSIPDVNHREDSKPLDEKLSDLLHLLHGGWARCFVVMIELRLPDRFPGEICLSIAEMKAIARKFCGRCCSIVEMKEIAGKIFDTTHIAVGDFARLPGGTPSKWRYESKEEKHVLMTENVVVSASTCRLKRPGCLVLSPLEADERQLNQELVIFEKSIGDESVHSPSTLLPSCPVLNKSRPQPDNSASLHGLSSGNVSWKNESNMKELKMERVRSWLCCNRNSEEFPSAEDEGCVFSFVAASQDKESKGETTPAESDDNSSDYFANAETSSCGSFEHDDEVTSNPEGKDEVEKGESKERLLEDPPYSSIPDVNHREDSKQPDEKQSGSSFLGVIHDDVDESFVCGGGTSSERTKCRSVSRIQEEKRLLMTENAVISASTCPLKRPACSRLPKVHERHLNQELGILEKSIDDESVHSPSTLLPSSSVLNNLSMQLSNSASLHGLFSGNVSWKNESNMKESKVEFHFLCCLSQKISVVFPVGGTSSERTKCRSVSRIQEEKRLLITENAVISASTCRLKRPACSRQSKVHEGHLNQELGVFEKSIGDECVHSPSTLLPSCSVLNKSQSQPVNSASLHGLYSGNVSWKKESNMKELKMERVRSWLCCNPNSEEFPSPEAASQDKESKEKTTPAESDDNSSDYFANAETNSHGSLQNDYFANAETSSRASFEHDEEFTSNPEGKDAAEKGF